MKWILILFFGISISLQVISDQTVKPGTNPVESPLVGHWVSNSIDGDALFFIVRQFEGRIQADGGFKGTVSYTDFETSTMTGKYTIKDDHIYIYKKGAKKPYKLRFKFKGPKKKIVIVTDEKFGVSIKFKRLKKGAKPDSHGIFSDF